MLSVGSFDDCADDHYWWSRSPEERLEAIEINRQIVYGYGATPPPDFREFLKSFEDEEVQYLLIGGYAVGFYGYPRATAGLDIWVAIHPDNARKIVSALQRFGMDAEGLNADLFLREGQIIRMGVPPIRIEIHTGISGVEFNACYARRQRAELEGITVNIIALDDLKANKRASGCHRDLEDIEHIP